MSGNELSYRGFTGSVHFDDQEQCFYGRVQELESNVSYDGDTRTALIEAFEQAVDDYLGGPPDRG